MRPALLLMALLSLATVAASPASALAAQPATETLLSGHVVSIADGDTLTLLTADLKQVKVRLAEIDTPEKRQPYGQRARQELAALAFRQQADVVVLDLDRYGRVVGRVSVDGHEVNAELLRRGAAWAYRDYLKRPELLALEAEARRQKLGLWALPASERMPPWAWRREQRLKREAARAAAEIPAG